MSCRHQWRPKNEQVWRRAVLGRRGDEGEAVDWLKNALNIQLFPLTIRDGAPITWVGREAVDATIQQRLGELVDDLQTTDAALAQWSGRQGIPDVPFEDLYYPPVRASGIAWDVVVHRGGRGGGECQGSERRRGVKARGTCEEGKGGSVRDAGRKSWFSLSSCEQARPHLASLLGRFRGCGNLKEDLFSYMFQFVYLLSPSPFPSALPLSLLTQDKRLAIMRDKRFQPFAKHGWTEGGVYLAALFYGARDRQLLVDSNGVLPSILFQERADRP